MKAFFSSRAGFLWGVAAVLLWGALAALSRTLLESLGMFTAGGCIYITGGLVCFLLYPPRRRSFSWKYHIGCGSLCVAYFLLYSVGLGLTSNRIRTVEVNLINYLWPLLTLVFSIFFFRKRVRYILLIPGILISFAGLALSSSVLSGVALTPASLWNGFRADPLPYLLMAGAAASWGLYSNLLGTVDKKTPTDALPYFMLAGGIALLCLRFPFHETSVWSLRVVIELAVMAVFPIGGGYYCWDKAMQSSNPVPAITFSYLTPLFSALFCAVLLGVHLPLLFYAACLMVIGGALCSRRAIRS